MSKRLAENRLIITTPLILGIASFIVFVICLLIAILIAASKGEWL